MKPELSNILDSLIRTSLLQLGLFARAAINALTSRNFRAFEKRKKRRGKAVALLFCDYSADVNLVSSHGEEMEKKWERNLLFAFYIYILI